MQQIEFTRPQIECGPQRSFAMPFGPDFTAQKKRLDFGPGKLKRNLLLGNPSMYTVYLNILNPFLYKCM